MVGLLAENCWPVEELMMQPTDEDWARSYARQALSDLRAREALVVAKAEKCHRLHFLQMAAEKACKAHLTIKNGHDKVRKSHAYVAKNLHLIAKQFYAMNPNRKQALSQVSEIKRLAHEIEVLAPACDDGDVRRDNSEYPWEDGKGNICTLCDYSFPNIDDGSRAIVGLIRLIRAASESYSH
jgi:hypothetical protein